MPDEKVVATNRKAYHDYEIEEVYEAGIVLQGTEVKSLRVGRANLRDSFARVKGDELYLHNVHISPYSHGNIANHEPRRMRKLLLHKAEIKRLMGKVAERGLTLVPLRIYFKGNVAKVELALARGKARYDKRRAIADRDAKRDIDRALRERQK
jgi:SsrA-binding protein